MLETTLYVYLGIASASILTLSALAGRAILAYRRHLSRPTTQTAAPTTTTMTDRNLERAVSSIFLLSRTTSGRSHISTLLFTLVFFFSVSALAFILHHLFQILPR